MKQKKKIFLLVIIIAGVWYYNSQGVFTGGGSYSGPAPGSAGGETFTLAAQGTALPRSDSYCASHVTPIAESVPENTAANHTIPSGSLNLGPWAVQKIAGSQYIDGNFTGTTGEILEWAACKWGWDEDYAFAEAVRESGWRQSENGDNGHSFGILQVRSARATSSPGSDDAWGGLPWIQTSTAFDADFQMAYLRSCYDGHVPGFPGGNAWECIGSWYSGMYGGSGSAGYISRVQAVYSSRSWPQE